MPYFPSAQLPDEAIVDCNTIAYQFIGAVQPHAGLLVIDQVTRSIFQASESTRGLLGIPAEDLLGKLCCDDLLSLPSGTVDRLLTNPSESPCLTVHTNASSQSAELTLSAHLADGLVQLAIEPSCLACDLRAPNLTKMLERLVSELANATSLPELAMKTTAVMREGLEVDRAMIYRFDDDWHGQVIGESLADDPSLESYLNLRFPASDVPKSARRMYEELSIRSSVDLSAEPSRLIALAGPKSQTPVDLGLLRIRATSPSCRTYYGNMGIRASIIVPMKVNGKIWGHVACHNRAPTRLPVELENTLVACGRVFSQSVVSLELSRRLDAERKTRKLQLELAAETAGNPHSPLSLQFKVDSLRQALNSEFACLKLDNEEISAGTLPESGVEKFLDALRARKFSGLFSTDRLILDLPELEPYAKGWGGMLAMPLDDFWNDAFVVLRKERVETGAWAGNPQEGLKWLASGKPEKTPRNSFAQYLAATENSSQAWSKSVSSK